MTSFPACFSPAAAGLILSAARWEIPNLLNFQECLGFWAPRQANKFTAEDNSKLKMAATCLKWSWSQTQNSRLMRQSKTQFLPPYWAKESQRKNKKKLRRKRGRPLTVTPWLAGLATKHLEQGGQKLMEGEREGGMEGGREGKRRKRRAIKRGRKAWMEDVNTSLGGNQ